jgi:hypothetical protein
VKHWSKPWGQCIVAGLAFSAGCASGQYAADERPAPGLTLPRRADLDESDAGAADEAEHAGSLDATWNDAGASPPGSLPDPKALRLARQWEYEVVYDRGEVRIDNVTERNFSQPVVTARRMGRYAIELWIGKELVERVRFDFPLLAAEEVRSGKRHPLKEPPSFGAGAVVSRRVLVPASPRATRAVLVDRATGRTLRLDWPPREPAASTPRVELPAQVPDTSDAGAPADTSAPAPDAPQTRK